MTRFGEEERRSRQQMMATLGGMGGGAFLLFLLFFIIFAQSLKAGPDSVPEADALWCLPAPARCALRPD